MILKRILLVFICLTFVSLLFYIKAKDSPSAISQKDPSLFVGLIIKNNDQLVPHFLKTIADLDYDKQAMTLQLNVCGDNPAVKESLKNWVNENSFTYAKISYVDSNPDGFSLNLDKKRFNLFGKIKDSYLETARDLNCPFCLILESDAFLEPFTLKELVAKDKPIIAPLLQPIPEEGDPYRNFFAASNPEGYYKHHPIYYFIADRQIKSCFKVSCVHSVYLIKTAVSDQLSFSDHSDEWEAVIFSRQAVKNNVEQYISNEKDFGSLLHFYKEPTHLEMKALSLELLNQPNA